MAGKALVVDANVLVRAVLGKKMGLDVNLQGDKFRALTPDAVLGALLPAAPLLGAAIGFLLSGWIDTNGRTGG
jgi:hypothetical protein